MRWNRVASAPMRSRTRSTSRVGWSESAFWPVHSWPMSTLGRDTSKIWPSSWLRALQRTVSEEKVTAPSRSSWSWATRRLRGTCFDSSWCVASQRVRRSRAARESTSSASRPIPVSTLAATRLRWTAKTTRNVATSSTVGTRATSRILRRRPGSGFGFDRRDTPRPPGARVARRLHVSRGDTNIVPGMFASVAFRRCTRGCDGSERALERGPPSPCGP